MGKLRRQAYNVVFADGHHVHAEGVFVVVGVGVHVVRDELLGVLVLHRYDGLKKVRQLAGVGLGAKVKVETLVVGLDTDTVLGGAVFDQQLFDVEERLPLVGLLP